VDQAAFHRALIFSIATLPMLAVVIVLCAFRKCRTPERLTYKRFSDARQRKLLSEDRVRNNMLGGEQSISIESEIMVV
jgi:hypothetical protein